MAETGASPLPPTPPARSPLFRAEHFVWLTARVLEQRLFAHHFLNGGADPVETALDAYRNEDGGYGHALEPDLRGPVSQPLHTAHALRVLDSIGRCGGQRAERVCRYLTSVSTRGRRAAGDHPGQRGYPAARFIPIVDDPPSELLATGPVVVLLHRNEVWHAWLFRATDFCWHTVESLEKSAPYEIEAAVAFLDATPDRPRAEAAADRLGRLVRDATARRRWTRTTSPRTRGPSRPGERHFPYDIARDAWLPRARVVHGRRTARSLDLLAEARRRTAAGRSTGQWAPGTALEARPMVTIEALRTLRAHGRPVG